MWNMMRYGSPSANLSYLDDRVGFRAKTIDSLPFFWAHALFSLVFGLLVLAILVALLRWLWKKGDKGR